MYEMMITKMVNLRVFKSAPILGSGRPKASFDSTEIAEDIYFLIEEMKLNLKRLRFIYNFFNLAGVIIVSFKNF